MEKITLKSFIHPLRTMRSLPVETLIFISLLSFSLVFLVVVSAFIKDNPYILGGNNLLLPLKIYKTELLISVCLLTLFLKKNIKFQFLNAVCISTLILTIFTIFYMKINSFQYISTHSHYLVLTIVFGFIYIFYYFRNSKYYFVFAVVLLFFCCLENIYIFNNLEGKYYAQTAKFLASYNKSQQNLNIFISERTEKSFWHIKTFNSVFKYYFPNKKIIFSSDINENSFALDVAHIRKDTEHFYPFIIKDKIASGDLFILRKTSSEVANSMQVIQNLPRELVYENKIFKIYKMK